MSNITRDDAPEYLARYARRRAEPITHETEAIGTETPAFVLRARERATLRALKELTRDDAPPGRTEEFARETVSPREQFPAEFRHRVSTSVDVRLIRHGQTQGYVTDGGLTPLGKWQAHRKGQDLAKGLKEGMTVRFPHAATARATETAHGVRGGVLQGLGRFGIGGVTVEEPFPCDGFRNFGVWAGGREMDVTAAFQEYARINENYQRHGLGDRPGWIVEMDRFYRVLQGGGDPITVWLTQPLFYFEPPINVVRRHWQAALDIITESGPDTAIYMCGHSGPIRAVAASAVGHDPGEPNNTEDVRIKIYDDREHAVLTYRGRGLEIEIPTLATPSWFTA
jgi:broad specificity phosphatase PhoE